MNTKRNTAFTLIELLTVIVIIGILAAIIIPTVGKVRDTARTAQCISNLRSLQQAASMAIEEKKGTMPDRQDWKDRSASRSIVPWLSLPPGTGANWPADATSPLRCFSANKLRPSDQAFGRTYAINHFACATMNGGAEITGDDSDTAKKISDVRNPSKTAFFTDGAIGSSGGAWWTYTRYQNVTNASPFIYAHNDGINIVFFDGHVRNISRAVMISDYKTKDSPLWGATSKN